MLSEFNHLDDSGLPHNSTGFGCDMFHTAPLKIHNTELPVHKNFSKQINKVSIIIIGTRPAKIWCLYGTSFLGQFGC